MFGQYSSQLVGRKTKTINAARLRTLRACSAQVSKFVSLFGEEDVEPTLALCVEHASTFDWEWARCLLSATARSDYDEATAPARSDYDEVTAAARSDYDEARAAARSDYDEAWDTAQCAYDEAWATAQCAYDEAWATAQRAYNETRAAAWFTAWQNS
jgi:hypothetical protein